MVLVTTSRRSGHVSRFSLVRRIGRVVHHQPDPVGVGHAAYAQPTEEDRTRHRHKDRLYGATRQNRRGNHTPTRTTRPFPPTAQYIRFWGVGMAAACRLDLSAGQKPFRSPTKSQQSRKLLTHGLHLLPRHAEVRHPYRLCLRSTLCPSRFHKRAIVPGSQQHPHLTRAWSRRAGARGSGLAFGAKISRLLSSQPS